MFTNELQELVFFIQDLTAKHLTLKDASINELISNTAEELGEFCQAHRVESGKKDKVLDEPAKNEAIDLTICALSLYFASGGTIDEFMEIASEKCNKWNDNIVSRKFKQCQVCTCHERDSSYCCSYCNSRGYFGHMQEDAEIEFKKKHPELFDEDGFRK